MEATLQRRSRSFCTKDTVSHFKKCILLRGISDELLELRNMRESSKILARLSLEKHDCKTLQLCHLEPNQYAYIRKELLHKKTSHGYA